MPFESIRTQPQAFLASREIPGDAGRALRKVLDGGMRPPET